MKQVKATASSILVLEYVEFLAFKEEQEENKPLRGKFMLNGWVFQKAIDFALRKRCTKTSYV
jgi:hypothetical protein